MKFRNLKNWKIEEQFQFFFTHTLWVNLYEESLNHASLSNLKAHGHPLSDVIWSAKNLILFTKFVNKKGQYNKGLIMQ